MTVELMPLDIALDRVYPHPIETVWAAVTNTDALATWLMDNDFAPHLGHRFTLRGRPVPGWRGWAACEVLLFEPPRRMVWSWQGWDEGAPSEVVFELDPVASGTQLRLHHRGQIESTTIELLRSGWPGKLAALGEALGGGSLVSPG